MDRIFHENRLIHHSNSNMKSFKIMTIFLTQQSTHILKHIKLMSALLQSLNVSSPELKDAKNIQKK